MIIVFCFEPLNLLLMYCLFSNILFLSFQFFLLLEYIYRIFFVLDALYVFRKCMYFCAVYLHRIVMRYFFCNLEYIKGEKRSRIADNAMHVQTKQENEEEEKEQT